MYILQYVYIYIHTYTYYKHIYIYIFVFVVDSVGFTLASWRSTRLNGSRGQAVPGCSLARLGTEHRVGSHKGVMGRFYGTCN